MCCGVVPEMGAPPGGSRGMAGDLTRLSATRAASRFTADSGHKAGCRGIELDAIFRQKRLPKNGRAAFRLQARDLHSVAPAPPAISAASQKLAQGMSGGPVLDGADAVAGIIHKGGPGEARDFAIHIRVLNEWLKEGE